jgi:hypothetical protein
MYIDYDTMSITENALHEPEPISEKGNAPVFGTDATPKSGTSNERWEKPWRKQLEDQRKGSEAIKPSFQNQIAADVSKSNLSAIASIEPPEVIKRQRVGLMFETPE